MLFIILVKATSEKLQVELKTLGGFVNWPFRQLQFHQPPFGQLFTSLSTWLFCQL